MDTGLCAGIPYLDIWENHEALVLIQTVCENFGKFTERQAHPTDESFKQMVSKKNFDNCSIVASDVTNARSMFGPNRPGLRGKQLDRGQSVLKQSSWECQGICTYFIMLLH